MLLEIVGVVVALVLVVFATLVLYARWNYGVLEAMGVPVEKPHWLSGSVSNIMDVHWHWEDLRKFKKLGPIYGTYEGQTPLVHVADPKIIHKILFTESEHFQKRSHDLGDPITNEAVEFLNGEKWKIVRNMLSPQLTTGKLKMQSQIVQNICNNYVEHLRAQADANGRISKVDLHEMTAPFAVEVIAEMLCGIKLNDAKNPSNPFVKNMRKMLFDDFKPEAAFKYVLAFPFMSKFMPLFDQNAIKMLRDYVRDVMELREKSGNEIPDMISVLTEMRKRTKTDEDYKRVGITEDTVYGQAFEFFIASYLGIVLSAKTLIYHLLNNPEVHGKVLKELETVLKKHDGELGYDAAVELEYLGACFTETLRISPGFFRPDRTCIKDWTHENITIKKGTQVAFPLYAIHHNEEIFPSPEKFQPERFLGENKANLPSCSFMTFGQGQRQCMGTRLASQLLKIYVGTLLKEFKIEKRPDTVWKEQKGSTLFVVWDPIYVDFVKK